MAKGVYIGVDGIAHKIKKGYVGIDTEIPIYETSVNTVAINASNISNYFTVTNGSYYFVGSGTSFVTNNGGIASSTAQTTLTAKQDISNITFSYRYSSEPNYDKFTLTVDGTTVENAVSGATTIKTYTGSLATGKSIVFKYVKDVSADQNDDECAFTDMNITIEVREQIGTEVKSLAKKVKKAYIGIGGVARPCWGERGLEYYGTVTDLSAARSRLAATTVGNYAIFGGGRNSSASKIVDSYDMSLTRTSLTELKSSRYDLAATTVGSYALFGGGSGGGGMTGSVDAYDTSLTSIDVDNLRLQRSTLAATTVGNYAIFGGGSNGSERYAATQAYDTSLTRTTPTELSVARYELAAAAIGNYALFGGGGVASDGGNSEGVAIVDAYDTSLTRTTPTELSVARLQLTATKIGNYALFGGGGVGDNKLSTIDAYNSSLTRTTPTELSVARVQVTATTVGNYALFGGGFSDGWLDAVDAYDESLTRTIPTELSVARTLLVATTVGGYALFGGGNDYNGYHSTVDAYTVL